MIGHCAGARRAAALEEPIARRAAPARPSETCRHGATRARVDAELVRRSQDGDAAARERLVLAHTALVRSLARRYQGMGLAFEDLVQEGLIGLLESLERFQPRAGVSFTTYAYLGVRRSMTCAVR